MLCLFYYSTITGFLDCTDHWLGVKSMCVTVHVCIVVLGVKSVGHHSCMYMYTHRWAYACSPRNSLAIHQEVVEEGENPFLNVASRYFDQGFLLYDLRAGIHDC